MKKIWILEGYITRERMIESVKEAEETLKNVAPEHVETAREMLAAQKKRLAENPEGYWFAYQGRTNYNVFCNDSRQTMRNLKERKMKWRVLKAEISETAKYWPGQYVNGIENDGVMRYLYATM